MKTRNLLFSLALALAPIAAGAQVKTNVTFYTPDIVRIKRPGPMPRAGTFP